ncbi:PCYCGC motif-containing (lipo)protein [Halobacillus sp. K22]|uniref:PCYCGC motif-containing (lipo)protein n=1 Tax=Halobacillus sp. K22 TaxID=3457431 RepID=UPI003FCEDF42
MILSILLSLLLISGLAGCGSSSNPSSEEEHQATHEEDSIDQVNGDIRETTKNQDELPAFLDNKQENMQMLYTAAAKNKELLEQMPCYCGCGESVGHRNNYDCFIHEDKAEGSVTWDDHATKCGVCLEIAAKAIVDYEEGKSIKEIRESIDQTYEKNYAEPTPTPEV